MLARSWSLPVVLVLCVLSGLLLFLSDYPVHAFWLQALALVPWLVALERGAPTLGRRALAGLLVGLGFNLPLAFVLEFPLVMAAGLGLCLALVWVLMSLGVGWVLRFRGAWGPLGAGAMAALVEWLDCALIPVWGTAQAFVRPLTACPWAIQFVAVGGVLGVVFVVVALQASLVRLWVSPPERRPSALVLFGLLSLVIGTNAVLWNRPVLSQVRVAALGWTATDLREAGAMDADAVLDRVLFPLARKAARKGAALVVTPETGLWLDHDKSSPGSRRKAVLARLAAFARTTRLTLAVGFFNGERQDNRLIFIGPDGQTLAEYLKTHLIPFIETYTPGTGQLAVVRLAAPGLPDGARLGGLICQDDNFTDLARGYGRAGVHLVAVPTNDWQQVKDHHLENSRFRPLEQGYGVVRAASNGHSAILSFRGEILAHMDPFADGPGVIVADLPLGRPGTLYTRLGEWVPLASGLLLLGVWLRNRRQPSSG